MKDKPESIPFEETKIHIELIIKDKDNSSKEEIPQSNLNPLFEHLLGSFFNPIKQS